MAAPSAAESIRQAANRRFHASRRVRLLADLGPLEALGTVGQEADRVACLATSSSPSSIAAGHPFSTEVTTTVGQLWPPHITKAPAAAAANGESGRWEDWQKPGHNGLQCFLCSHSGWEGREGCGAPLLHPAQPDSPGKVASLPNNRHLADSKTAVIWTSIGRKLPLQRQPQQQRRQHHNRQPHHSATAVAMTTTADEAASWTPDASRPEGRSLSSLSSNWTPAGSRWALRPADYTSLVPIASLLGANVNDPPPHQRRLAETTQYRYQLPQATSSVPSRPTDSHQLAGGSSSLEHHQQHQHLQQRRRILALSSSARAPPPLKVHVGWPELPPASAAPSLTISRLGGVNGVVSPRRGAAYSRQGSSIGCGQRVATGRSFPRQPSIQSPGGVGVGDSQDLPDSISGSSDSVGFLTVMRLNKAGASRGRKTTSLPTPPPTPAQQQQRPWQRIETRLTVKIPSAD